MQASLHLCPGKRLQPALLLAVLWALLSSGACTYGVVSNLDELRSAAFTGGTYVVVNASIPLAGSLTLNGTNTSLTLLGNTTACGGLCVLDAQRIGGHFVVSMNYTLIVDNIAFVNSLRGSYSPEPCLGEVVRNVPGLGDALTLSRNCASGQLGGAYLNIAHLNDLPCGFLRCSSIIVAANASLFVNNSLFANNTGNAGQFGAMGAAISVVATVSGGLSIENAQFINNVVQDSGGGSWGNSGGAISIDQPFSAMNYPISPTFYTTPDSSLWDWNSIIPAPPPRFLKLQILNCTFTRNQAARGGSLFLALNSGTLNITGSTFDGNVALGTFNWLSGLGGAIYAHQFVNSRPFKGAINDYGVPEPDIKFLLHPHYVITDCRFLNNAARTRSDFLTKGTQAVTTKGGAVAAQYGGYGISFVRCTFVGNTATNGGALFYSGVSRTNDVFLYNHNVFNFSQVNDGKNPYDFDGINSFHEDYARIQPEGFPDYLSLAPYPAEFTTYLLLVDSSTFFNNTAASGVAAATGGALHIDCGTAVITASVFSANSITISGTSFDALNSGGALFATNDCLTADTAHLLTTNVTVLDSAFESNQAYASGAAVASSNHVYPGSGLQGGTIELVFVRSSFVNNTGTQLGGALYLDATSHATLLRCNLSSNAAVQGGAIYALGGAAQHTFNDSDFVSNVAAVGGAVAAAGSTLLATNACAYATNVAINGSAIAVLSGAALYSDGDVYSTNAASSYGGAVFSTGNATLSNSTMSNNTALVGAAVFSALALPPSTVAAGNVAKNYGPVSATLPASYALFYSAGVSLPLADAALSFRSGAALNLSLQLYDLHSQSVSFWPDLTADVRCLTCDGSSAVVGNTNAIYYAYSAAFTSLAVAGSVSSMAVLGLTVASPSIPLFGASGVTINISVTIAPCGPLEIFQKLRCLCAPGTFLNGTSQQCQTCSPGSYSPAPGAVACTVNPPGFASSMQTTFASNVTLAGVSAANFGATQNRTLTATLATTLAAPASTIVITAVTSAAPSGRHLLQASAAVAFSVTTANATQASSLRSALDATATLARSLTTALCGSADPVLSAVTGVVAAPPEETNLVLAALPCPAGTYLNGLTQSCEECAVGLVATSTGSTTCSKCPPRSAWVNSSLCSPCPDSSVASPGNPAQCACSAGFYDTRFGVSLAEPVCQVCPLGGACDTGLIGAAAGYWRENEQSDAFVQCREGNCLAETVIGPLSMLAAPLLGNGTLGAGHNCVDGNSGPLCGVCIPGYAMQSGVCAPCDPADAWDNWSPGSKAGLLIGCIIFAFVVLSFLFFQPLVPSLERSAAAVLGAAKAAPGYVLANLHACCCCCFVKRSQPAPAEEAKADKPKKLKRTSKTVVVAASEENKGQADDASKKKKDGEPDAAADFARNGNIASAGGNMAAFSGDDDRDSGGDDDAESEEGGGSGNEEELSDGDSSGGGVEGNLDFFDWLEEFTEKMEKVSKVVINFYQIVSTFLKSLDVPWPNIFGVVMARVNVVNLNLVQLPAAACLNPSPSYYKQFNGYTLGLVLAMLSSAAMWLFGSRVVARISLSGMPEEERATRLTQFRSTVISRMLLVLYITYPGVSVTIFGIFTCTTLPVSGTAYLDADLSIQCYDREHWKYVAAGVVWLFVVPFGVPAFFLWLLRRFDVPKLAALVSDNAFLREAIKLAWTEGLAQPADSHKLTVDSISDLHLEALYVLFVKEHTPDEASDILAGVKAPVEEAPAQEPESQHLEKEGTVARVRRLSLLAASRATEAAKDAATGFRCSGSIFVKDAELSPAAARRVFLMKVLLHWCRNSGRVAVAPLHWQTLESLHAYTRSPDEGNKLASGSADVIKLHSKDVAHKVKYALSECGFLFSAYRVDCWYWEVVELIRKLMLTSILALIAPGSAGQVVAGLLIAFVMLFINVKMKPYASGLLNFVSVISQTNLFCFLLVALLLKVNLDGESRSGFFSFIVGFLSLVPIVLPIVIRVIIRAYGNMESRMLVKDNTFR